jgi:signal transduction histidine kinase
MAPDNLLLDAVGAAYLTAAVVVASRGRRRRMGLLLLSTAVTWWLGGLGDWVLFWHRGPLTHALLAYPTGRLTGRLARVVVVGGYVLAVLAPLDRFTVVNAGFAVAGVGAGFRSAVGSRGPLRDQRWLAAAAAALVMGALSVGALVRAWGVGAEPGALRGYELALVAGALVLAGGDVWDRWSEPTTTRLVVELGAAPAGGPISGLVADALGDPSAELFYWLPDADGFVDEAGHAVPDPGSDAARAQVTDLEHDGARVGVLVHDAGVGQDPDLVKRVAALASLAVAGVRLRAHVEEQLEAVEASRRRLVTAAELERQQLATEVRQGPARHLGVVSELLAVSGRPEVELADAAATAQRSLDAFAAGIDPVASSGDGLAGALAGLARQFTIPTSVAIEGDHSAPSSESTAYFVCAEALSNIGKHADASQVSVRVTVTSEAVRVVVTDDGVGGATLSARTGTGLAGLRDRVEALGGTLTVHSPVGGGTRVEAVIPA